MLNKYKLLLLIVLSVSCKKTIDKLETSQLFTKIPASISGVTFENKILESEQLHYYKYLYIYIGGGVAAADFNNDGLEDLFFTSNIYHNKLFLNKGNFQFEDITIKAGIKKRPGFDVGTSVVDVNNDGFLDIYINRAGWYNGDEKLANMLYINNGDLTFTEKAQDYGLADTNRSIASTFFDYDKDGDLDVYIANAPSGFALSDKIIDLDKIKNSQETNSFKGTDKLYNNDGNGHFTDVSLQAGIMPDLGFGLNAQVGDLNNDGWPDIYVSNDFITPDFAYINNGDGTFSEKRDSLFKHMSYYSMGSDIADINNDGFSDLMVLDMSPEDYVRSKTTMSMMSIDRFWEMINMGYHYQYMHNVMQVNNGNGTFSEVANMSGLAKTDWSWAALIADFDLDGLNDIYVTNGIYRDVVDRDTNIAINKYINTNKENLKEKDFYEFTQKLPQQKLTNYLFKNKGGFKFDDVSSEWADEKPTFSNGAVYVDLDNDGDLDIVTNNLDENATILRNNARAINTNNYLQLVFKGPKTNAYGVGSTVKIYQDNGEVLTRQLFNARGYLSSVSNKLHFGLGQTTTVPKVEIIWGDGKTQTLNNVATNQLLSIDYAESIEKQNSESNIATNHTLFEEKQTDLVHVDLDFNDFDKQVLLPHKLSQTGPCVAVKDLNQDGLDDVFIGGGHNQEAQLLMGNKDGGFTSVTVEDFVKDKSFEDISASFFDADNDGDADLYVVSGSYEFDEDSPLLQDRLYINNGRNDFKRSTSKLPEIKTSGSIVVTSDYDQDGDIDVFVGGRVIPGKYPYAPESYLLINENGTFVNKTKEQAPELEHIGMVTSAQWSDIDNDDDLDLIVTGEWMGIEVFVNNKGELSKDDTYKNLSDTKGWWNTILVQDIDNDGDQDIVAGNLGLNYKFHASKEKPFHVYTKDYDGNGTEDIMLAKYYNDKQVPVRGKGCTAQQMPYLKERITSYNEFANRDIAGIIGDNFSESLHYEVVEFQSGIFLNQGDKGFVFSAFPIEAQIAPINSIIFDDFDGDAIKDLLMAGNNYQSEVETTRADAGTGAFLKGLSGGAFKYINNRETGFYADGDVRAINKLNTTNGGEVLVVNNNDFHQIFKISKDRKLD
ncbi:VCBS repeat-containing protein [Aestuariivivens insulae]|uniref:VCBS repeat-containing protein n=1 Tax=Aestuariivivens insulae TaxID=1621988 RepID=UPI001F59AD40|nr:VCBS repeat-containing protein [Aestuariivivens insulae]